MQSLRKKIAGGSNRLVEKVKCCPLDVQDHDSGFVWSKVNVVLVLGFTFKFSGCKS